MASFEPFVSSDPFSMSTFNSKLGGAFEKVDADVKTNADAISGLQTELTKYGNCKIVVGTYIGDGRYGSPNSQSLSFSGKPDAVFILPPDKNDGIGPITMLRNALWTTTKADNDYYSIHLTWGANSVSWYGERNPNLMANSSGKTYHYVALLE